MTVSEPFILYEFKSARSRIATDAVESGGIGIIVPISGNHVFPLAAHPVFGFPLLLHRWHTCPEYGVEASCGRLGIKPKMLGEPTLPNPATADRIGTSDGVLLHASSACRRGNVVERLRTFWA